MSPRTARVEPLDRSRNRPPFMRQASLHAAEVFVETAAASHDLHATLSLVEPDGRAVTLTAHTDAGAALLP